ncbi:hypothetical protein [Leptospira borgpetersenii]|nr:hypothetical protein [Leptospira borgpetersenii]
MNIYNFDHGFKSPNEVAIGSFIFKIDQSHCIAVTKLARSERTLISFGWRETQKRSIKKIRPSWQITARLHFFKASKPAQFYKKTKSFNEIDDICLLASFLTGRKVCTRRSIHRVQPGNFSKSLILPSEFFSVLEKLIQQKAKLNNSHSITAIHNLVVAQGSSDFLEAGMYTFSAINVLYDQWWEKNRSNMISKSKIRLLRSKVYSMISKQIALKIRVKLLKASRDENIHPILSEDLSYSLLSGMHISSLMKFRFFLISLNLFPDTPNQFELEQLKWLNGVRNSLCHSGTMPNSGRNVPEDAIFRLSKVAILVQMDIVRIAIADLLNLNTFNIQNIKSEIKNFFVKGVYNGQNVYNESYANYLNRISHQWEEEGFL